MGKRKHTFVILSIAMILVIVGIIEIFFTPQVEIDIEADRSIAVDLFYDNGQIGEYSFDDQHLSDQQGIGQGKNKTYFKIPADRMNKIRIDFGCVPCRVKIYKIKFFISPFQIKSLDGKQISSLFREENDISSSIIDQDRSVSYVISGKDGYIAATSELLQEATEQINYLMILYIGLAFVVLVGVGGIIRWVNKDNIKIILYRIYQKNNIIQIILKVVSSAIVSIIAGLIVENVVLHLIYKVVYNLGMQTLTKYFAAALIFSWRRVNFFSILFFVALLVVCLGAKKSLKYRYVLAAVLLALMTIGGYTGSSIGYYDNMLKNNTEDYQCSTLLGIPQGIRGDEWATEKPYYFAQQNGIEDAPYFNHSLMLDGADMVVNAFAPIKDVITLFRPSLLGFLILPADNAFAFYWWWKLIALFMASLELCHLISARWKYSIIGATVILFSPPNQWWMSQAVIETMAFGSFALICYQKCLTTNRRWSKYLWMLAVYYFLTGFVLTMYPASQIPFAYIYLAILLWILHIHREKKPFSKSYILIYLITAIPYAIVLLRFITMSGKAINILLGTVYPGTNRTWSTLSWKYEFYQLINLFTSSIRHPDFLNSCEISQYFSFSIVVIPFMIYLCLKKKKIKSAKLIFLFSIFLFVITWMPEIPMLNKITLLNMSYPVRITMGYGLGFVLTIIALLPQLENDDFGLSSYAARICVGIGCIVLTIIAFQIPEVSEYMEAIRAGKILLVFAMLCFSTMAYWFVTGGRKNCNRFAIALVLINVISTAFINPVTQGTDSMFQKTTMQAIRQINSEEKGRWMVSGSPTIANLVTAQGVSRTSGTYYYPDWTMMKLIDPEEQYVDLWNQYAHIDMRLTTGQNKVTSYDDMRNSELDAVNRIVYINLETAHKLGIKYVFTMLEIPQEMEEDERVILRYEDPVDNWKIYEIRS